MIYIIIPVFNRWEFTKLCLESLLKQTYKDYKIIVVDHGSSDDTSEKIRHDYPNVILLTGEPSMWWTAATNLGIRYALENNTDYILTLNNDTIAEDNYLEELLKVNKLLGDDILIGSTAIDFTTKNITFSGENENWWLETATSNHLNILRMKGDYISCSRFPGRGLLIPAKVFQRIGLFDEVDFPHYLADYDFTNKARINGFKIVCATKARLKTFPEESIANTLTKNKSIKMYYQHLFGIKGGAQLKLFYKYALRYCPWYALPSFLVLGTIRRIVGYWFK